MSSAESYFFLLNVCTLKFSFLKTWNTSWICISSLLKGHANLFFMVPIKMFFSCLLHWLGLCVWRWIRVVKGDSLSLFPVLGGKASSFSPLNRILSCRFLVHDLINCRSSPLFLACWEFLSWISVWFYWMLFLHLLIWSYGFSSLTCLTS